jgi:glycosyltransferase involved in cell wall biosynthesis
VGKNLEGDFGEGMLRTIAQGPGKDRVHITGWASAEGFRDWLAAADLAVQLRTQSRGETSAAVLDCLNHGLATITNAHGSMAELPRNVVWMLNDDFQDQELVQALEALWRDTGRRTALGAAGRSLLREHHDPNSCARQYSEAIEDYYAKAKRGLPGLLGAVARQETPLPAAQLPRLAKALAANFPPKIRRRQLLLDISALVHTDLKTGIERVTRALLQEIALNPPTDWQVEPVYATSATSGYRYARHFMCRFLGIAEDWAKDALVDAWPGDVFLGLDLAPHVVAAQENILLAWRGRGVSVFFIVYDLLPVLLPKTFPELTQRMHQRWLSAITQFDGALAISRAVADDLYEWVCASGPIRELPYAFHWFHLGSDVDQSAPSEGLPPDAHAILNKLRQRRAFLMVGTIEPRKGHAQTLAAFDQLWTQGFDVNLVIVGKKGWMVEPFIERLQSHPENGTRLFWLEGISDEYLEQVYAAGTCLIAASYGEGFGLPLIEAVRHGLPLLVRDIPVFREVTAGKAHFFPDSRESGVIAKAVQDWLSLYKLGQHPSGDAVPHQTWKDSARQVLDAVLGKVEPYKRWK